MQESKVVSIVIPVYNGANYMRAAIDSALGQTYPHCEVLVVNDGSTDGGATDAIARSYGDRIRYYSKENGGVASAINFAFDHMNGDYFAWLSHDDWYAADNIESLMRREIAAGDETVLYAGWINHYEASDDEVRIEFSYLPSTQLDCSLYAASNGITNACTMLIPKVAIDKTGRFDETLRVAQDDEYIFRLAKVSAFRYVSQCKVYKRIHPGQDSNRLEKYLPLCSRVWIKNIASVTEQEAAEMYGSPYAYYSHMKQALAAAQYLDAKMYARELANRYAPEITDPFPLAVRQATNYTGLHAAVQRCPGGYRNWLCRRYLTKPELKNLRFLSFAKKMLLQYLPVVLSRRLDKDIELAAALQAASLLMRIAKHEDAFADEESHALLFALVRSALSLDADYIMPYQQLNYRMFFESDLLSPGSPVRLVCIAADTQPPANFTERFGPVERAMLIQDGAVRESSCSLDGFHDICSALDADILERLATFGPSYVCMTSASTAALMLKRILPAFAETRPGFAINVSYTIEGLLDCMDRLTRFDSRYKFFLRHYSGTLQNTILYAILAT